MRTRNGKLRLNIGGYLGGALCILVAWAFLPPQVVPRQVSGIVMVGATLFGDYLVERIRARSARRAAATAAQRAAPLAAAGSLRKPSAAQKGTSRGAHSATAPPKRPAA